MSNISKARATINMIAYYRNFLKSECEFCYHWHDHAEWGKGGRQLTKAQARRELSFLINTAIQRRAGIWERPYDDSEHAMRRDQRNLHAIINNRLRVYQFETKEVRKRYGHLLARYDD